MFKFDREKILPLFLAKQMTVAELARAARISHKAAYRAVNGLSITAPVVDKTSRALNFEAIAYLENSVQSKEMI